MHSVLRNLYELLCYACTKNRIRNRYTLNLVLLVCFLTTALGVAGCRKGGVRVRSWEEAINFARAELDAAGDLEGRLEGYARTAARLSDTVDILDQAHPGLELIDGLRDTQIPLFGNGWQVLLFLLGIATFDGAKIIARLEETLRSLVDLKSSLDGLTGLTSVAEAVGAFRVGPNRSTLGALTAASATALPSLRRLQTDLGEILGPLRDVAGDLSGLVQGLRSAADAEVPLVSDAARQAAERIGLIEEPLLALRDGLDQLHQDIAADAEVLERIQEAVRQAREHEE